MTGTVELLGFAIQAAVSLARAGRAIYVENTVVREIEVPFPSAFASDLTTARAHAERVQRDEPARFAARFKTAYDRSFEPAAAKEGARELVQLYLLDLSEGRVPQFAKEARALAGLAALRQWQRGEEPFPHPLQRAAGAIVEVAVDYFVQVPGAINERTKYGRSLRALLEGLDPLDFQTARWDSIVIGLFTAALDTAGAMEIGGKLKPAVEGVARDVKAHLAALPPEGECCGRSTGRSSRRC